MKRLATISAILAPWLVLAPAGLAAQQSPGDSARTNDAPPRPGSVARADSAARTDGGDARVSGLRKMLRNRVDSLRTAFRDREEEERKRISRRVGQIEHRLRMGDFPPGRAVKVEVARMDRWSGRFTIGPDRQLPLPGIEPISLHGVLEPEAERVVSAALESYIRDPDVTLESLRRIAVTGAVSEPGFYHFSEATTVSEAVMTAGGPTRDAELEELAVKRDGRTLTGESGSELEGRTLEQLGLGSGDAVRVPGDGGGGGLRSWMVAAGSLGSVLGVALAVF